MKTRGQKTGNLKGVILPQCIFKECRITDEVNIKVKEMQVFLNAPQNVKRKGWAEAFKEMAANGDDELVMPDVLNDEDIAFFENHELPQYVLDGIKKGQDDIVAGGFITHDEFKKKRLLSANPDAK